MSNFMLSGRTVKAALPNLAFARAAKTACAAFAGLKFIHHIKRHLAHRDDDELRQAVERV